MSTIPNYLKAYRKRTPLMQEEMSFLSDKPDTTNISRYEKGQREPNNETLLVYHYIFDAPIEELLKPESRIVKQKIVERIRDLINELRKEEQITLKNTFKINFLEQTFNRLTT
ncbi:MAG: helix-turn-helix transcriptional regulator [Saprospiraceae bacterium]|jgi:transcriptional regulator with XRE-family HTH domain|nr:helix-turn-helix transcriptional regulator [Candidatus Defluviibacterium haderslevense]